RGGGRVRPPPPVEEGIPRPAAAPAQPVLVSVYLQGGIDSMSVLYPVGDPLYTKYRPVLALPEGAGPAFTEDPRLHWHPMATPLAQLHAEGKLSVLPAVGYTDPDQSHFTSRHFWEVGATQAALATARMPVATIDTPSSYSFYARGVWGPPQTIMYDYFDALGQLGARSGDQAMAQSGQAALMSSTLRRQLLPFQPSSEGGAPALPAGYPSGSDRFP